MSRTAAATDRPRPRRTTRRRAAWAAALVLTATTVAACGFDVQTNQAYTPAEGVNLDVGTTATGVPLVKVRNLMVVSRDPAQGFLATSIQAEQGDTLTAVSGEARGPHGGDAAPLEVSMAPVELPAGQLVLLTEQATPVVVRAERLQTGYTVALTLTFAEAGTADVVALVEEGSDAPLVTVTPLASSTPSPSS